MSDICIRVQSQAHGRHSQWHWGCVVWLQIFTNKNEIRVLIRGSTTVVNSTPREVKGTPHNQEAAQD